MAVRYRTVVVLVRRVQCVSETGSCRAPKIRVSSPPLKPPSTRAHAHYLISGCVFDKIAQWCAFQRELLLLSQLLRGLFLLIVVCQQVDFDTCQKRDFFFLLFRRSRPCVTSFQRGVYFFRGVVCSFSLAHFEVKETMSKEEVGGKEGDRGTLFRSLFSSIEEKTKMEEGIIALRQIFTTLENAFFGRFSPKLSHARSHALSQQRTAHKMPLLRDFHEKYLQHRFGQKSGKFPRKKCTFLGAALRDKNKHARSEFDFPAKKFDFLRYF